MGETENNFVQVVDKMHTYNAVWGVKSNHFMILSSFFTKSTFLNIHKAFRDIMNVCKISYSWELNELCFE